MKNEKLKELLEDFLTLEDYDTRQDLKYFVKENYNDISKQDLEKVILSLLNINTTFYVARVDKYSDVIDNIDNEEFLDDEGNYC